MTVFLSVAVSAEDVIGGMNDDGQFIAEILEEMAEAFDMERAKVTFWRGLTIAACVIGIVGIVL